MENNVGGRILEVRNKRDYTQEELAEKVGSVPSYISNIERKNKCPSLPLLRKIVKELDKQLEIKYREMFREIKKLDVNTQNEFFNLADNIIKSFKKIENNSTKK